MSEYTPLNDQDDWEEVDSNNPDLPNFTQPTTQRSSDPDLDDSGEFVDAPNTQSSRASDSVDDSGLPENTPPNSQMGDREDSFNDLDLPWLDSSPAIRFSVAGLPSTLLALNLSDQAQPHPDSQGLQTTPPTLTSNSFLGLGIEFREGEEEEQVDDGGDHSSISDPSETTSIRSGASFESQPLEDQIYLLPQSTYSGPSHSQHWPLPSSSPPSPTAATIVSSEVTTAGEADSTNNIDYASQHWQTTQQNFQDVIHTITQTATLNSTSQPLPTSFLALATTPTLPPGPSIPAQLPAPAPTSSLSSSNPSSSAPHVSSESIQLPTRRLWRPKVSNFGINNPRCPMCVKQNKKKACSSGPPCDECKRRHFSAEECQSGVIAMGDRKDKERDDEKG